MRIGYVRVSTILQNTERQEEALPAMNVEKVFIEKVSGKDRNRPQLRAMMEFVQPGDVVVIESISRLGRSVSDLYDIAKELKEKGVGLESIKESIDLSSASGNLTFGVLAAVAQFERDIMLERQREGIAVAKKSGKRWGRETVYGTDDRLAHEVFSAYSRKKISLADAMSRLGGIKRSSFYYRLNKWKAEQAEAGLQPTTEGD